MSESDISDASYREEVPAEGENERSEGSSTPENMNIASGDTDTTAIVDVSVFFLMLLYLISAHCFNSLRS